MRIGLVGRAGAGKSTLASVLVNCYGFEKFSLADEVREIARKLGYDVRKPYSQQVREVLQIIGMTGRMLCEDIWIRKLLEKIGNKQKIVIDDIRFKNEVKALKEHGFLIVKLECPEEVLKERLGEGYVDPMHPSEIEVFEIKADIVFNCTKPVEEIADILVERYLSWNYSNTK